MPVITGGNWNRFRIIQNMPQQRTGKAQNQGTTENSHIARGTHTSDSIDVKVRNIHLGK